MMLSSRLRFYTARKARSTNAVCSRGSSLHYYFDLAADLVERKTVCRRAPIWGLAAAFGLKHRLLRPCSISDRIAHGRAAQDRPSCQLTVRSSTCSCNFW